MVVSSENGLEFSGFVDELSSTVIACNELDLFGYNPTSVGASFSYDSSGTSRPVESEILGTSNPTWFFGPNLVELAIFVGWAVAFRPKKPYTSV